MRRTARWLVLGAVGIFTTTGCSDPFGIEDVLGTWDTISIDGQSVPGTVVFNGQSDYLQYWRWSFGEEGVWGAEIKIEGQVSYMYGLNYTVDLEEKTIRVPFLFSDVIEGSVDGSRMTLTGPGDHVWVLRRQ